MGGRVVEGARLESAYTPKGYRGFESHPIRHLPVVNHDSDLANAKTWPTPTFALFQSGLVGPSEPQRLAKGKNTLSEQLST
jgi:hypothetical protein